MMEVGPSYLRQRAVVEQGGTLVDVVASLVEEMRTDKPTPMPAREPQPAMATRPHGPSATE